MIRLIERQQHQLAELHTELREVRNRLEARTAEAAAATTRAELLEQRIAEFHSELERTRRPWWRRVFSGL